MMMMMIMMMLLMMTMVTFALVSPDEDLRIPFLGRDCIVVLVVLPHELGLLIIKFDFYIFLEIAVVETKQLSVQGNMDVDFFASLIF